MLIFNYLVTMFSKFILSVLSFEILELHFFEFIIFGGLITLFMIALKLISSYKKDEAD